jgi:hypothetical protein
VEGAEVGQGHPGGQEERDEQVPADVPDRTQGGRGCRDRLREAAGPAAARRDARGRAGGAGEVPG